MTAPVTGNVAFASAAAQLGACLGKLVQHSQGQFDSGLPPFFSDELLQLIVPFRAERWRFLEIFPLAVQLGHARALQADEFLHHLERFLAADGRLDRQRFGAFLQWAPELARQIRRLGDKTFRDDYMHVLRQTWAEHEDRWNDEGLPQATTAAAAWSRHLATSGGSGPLFPENLFALSPVFSDIIAGAAQRGTLRIIPLWAISGGFYLPVDDEVYIGFAPEAVQFIGQMEERAEHLSAQFAALSNKTRVQLLFMLNEHLPQTVGDLAVQLNLPHSNVSTHLKVLQQAGLVHLERSGVRTLVTRNRETVAALKRALDFTL